MTFTMTTNEFREACNSKTPIVSKSNYNNLRSYSVRNNILADDLKNMKSLPVNY